MTRLLIYCDHWQNGGVEAFLMNQLLHWDLRGWQCTILSAEKTTDIYDQQLKKLGVRQDFLLDGERTSPVFRILTTFSAFEAYLKAHPCDILYLNLTNSVTMRYAKIARKLGIKRRIVHSHCSGIQPGPTRFLKLMAHKVARGLYTNCATDWWACSHAAAEFLFEKTALPKVCYIPNAIEVEKFAFDLLARQEVRQQLGVKESDRLIGTVGRCTPEKNQAFLLKAFALAREKDPALKLLVVGDGPLRTSLEEQARQLGVRDACMFYGFTDTVGPLYSAMDLFCLPSALEGLGIVAIEAQANGCPCLLSDQVPGEAAAGGKVCFLPIDMPSRWVEPMLHFSALQERVEQVGIAQEYDITQSALNLQKRLRANKEVSI